MFSIARLIKTWGINSQSQVPYLDRDEWYDKRLWLFEPRLKELGKSDDETNFRWNSAQAEKNIRFSRPNAYQKRSVCHQSTPEKRAGTLVSFLSIRSVNGWGFDVALPKAHRLRLRQDFNRVYQKGRRRKASRLTLCILRHKQPSGQLERDRAHEDLDLSSAGCQPTRIGVSISQKVSKSAVVRNRIKRQLHAGLLQYLPQFSCGWDLVLVVHPQAVQCDYFQFLQELEQLLMDAEVLNGHS
jgi:ribonuclease P protein component